MKKLKIILGLLLALTLLGFKTTPAHAVDLWPFDNLWSSFSCVTDIDCTGQAVGMSGFNFIYHNTVGKDFEDMEKGDLEAMLRGEWNKGLAGGVGKIGALAYDYPPPVHFADYFRQELSDTLLSSPASAQTTFGDFFLSPIQI